MLWNVAASVGSQLTGIAISLIIPRLIIAHYGSEVNGFVSSVARIAAYFAVVQGGVVAAAGAHLFRAFARQDTDAVRAIYVAAHRFFLRSGAVLALVAAVFCLAYPLGFWGTDFYGDAVAMAAMAFVGVVGGYLVFFKYNLIVDSDQKSYVIVNSVIVTNLLVAAAQVALILAGAPIMAVMAVVPLAAVIRLALTRAWVRRSYPYLRLEGPADTAALDQKWDSLAITTSRLLKFVLPSVIASVMLGFEYASVFLVYATVFSVGSSIVEMASTTLAATLGRLVAEGDHARVRRSFEAASLVAALAAAGLTVCFAVLFPSFLQLYVGGVADVDYWAPVLMWSCLVNEFFTNIRLGPNLLVRATGHLRQTRSSALVELGSAAVLTPLGVLWLGVDGLMIGSVLSSAYRTVYLEWYCRRRLGMGGSVLLGRRLAALLAAVVALLIAAALLPPVPATALGWTLAAIVTAAVTGAVLLAAAWLVERPTLVAILTMLRPRRR